MKNKSNPHEITVYVDDEKELYAPFSNNDEFSDSLSDHIISKLDIRSFMNGTVIRVISAAPIDESDFEAAFRKWLDIRKDQIEKDRRNHYRKEILMFCIGISFIALGLILNKTEHILIATVLTTIGSFAIWEAAAVWIIERPKNIHRKWLLRRFKQGCTLKFENKDPHI